MNYDSEILAPGWKLASAMLQFVKKHIIRCNMKPVHYFNVRFHITSNLVSVGYKL